MRFGGDWTPQSFSGNLTGCLGKVLTLEFLLKSRLQTEKNTMILKYGEDVLLLRHPLIIHNLRTEMIACQPTPSTRVPLRALTMHFLIFDKKFQKLQYGNGPMLACHTRNLGKSCNIVRRKDNIIFYLPKMDSGFSVIESVQ